MRCGDCKHWQPVIRGMRDRGLNSVPEPDMGQCYATAGSDLLQALNCDGEYGEEWQQAVLATKPDFGCVLFERKEPA